MAKKIIKEIIIILLITLAIILILGVLLYEYIPSNKIIPDKISYTTPENIKEVLAEQEIEDDNNPIMTYKLEPTDINNYRRIDSYVPGKVNPFSSYEDGTQNSGDNGSSAGGSSENSGSSNNGSTTIPNNDSNVPNNSSSGGHLLPDRGTK